MKKILIVAVLAVVLSLGDAKVASMKSQKFGDCKFNI